jgi:hypothetical protein
MSRAHAVAPMVGADVPFRRPVQGVTPPTPKGGRHSEEPAPPCYFERAMLLWPRLERAKIRRVADDPCRIAEIVARRTKQPCDVILAMLTKQAPPITGPTEETAGFQSARSDAPRVTLRIVRSEEGNEIQVQDLLPA